jgi:hypothetical protein
MIPLARTPSLLLLLLLLGVIGGAAVVMTMSGRKRGPGKKITIDNGALTGKEIGIIETTTTTTTEIETENGINSMTGTETEKERDVLPQPHDDTATDDGVVPPSTVLFLPPIPVPISILVPSRRLALVLARQRHTRVIGPSEKEILEPS